MVGLSRRRLRIRDRRDRCARIDRGEVRNRAKERSIQNARRGIPALDPVVPFVTPPGPRPGGDESENTGNGGVAERSGRDLGGAVRAVVEADARAVESRVDGDLLDLGVEGVELFQLSVALCLEWSVVRMLTEGLICLGDAHLEFELRILQGGDGVLRCLLGLFRDDLFIGSDDGVDDIDSSLCRGLGRMNGQEVRFELSIGRNDCLDLVGAGIATEHLGSPHRHGSRFENLRFVGDVSALVDVGRERIDIDGGAAGIRQQDGPGRREDGRLNGRQAVADDGCQHRSGEDQPLVAPE